MTKMIRIVALLLVPLLYACGGSNNNNDNGGELRLTHASADAPAVNVYIDGVLTLEAVEFKQSSGLVPFAEPGTIEVEVRGILPDGTEASVIGPVTLTLSDDIRTDVVAIGDLFDGSGALSIMPKVLDPVEIEDEIEDVRVTVLHAAPDAGPVSIYVTSPGADISSVEPINAAFEDAAGPVALMPDAAYQIRVTPQGSEAVVFDTGSLSFPAGTELVLAAVENTYKVGASPITLLAIGAEGASEVVDVNMGAQVRVVHNSADTPAVDVLVNGAVALDAVPFPGASMYSDIEAPAGTYNVVVAADADNSIAPIDADLTLEATASYTVLAIGSFADSTVEALVLSEDRRNLATAAKVEVIHGSYLVASEIPVDIYLTADGVIADASPAVEGLAYKESTGQLQVAPGDYWITVTAAGDKAVVAFDTGGTLALEAHTNYTVIARDPAASEMGSPLINVTLLTD